MRLLVRCSVLAFGLLLPCCAMAQQNITVSVPPSQSAKPLDGRVLFLLSNNDESEPRMQINDTMKSQVVFGVTVDGLKPGEPVTIDDSAAGYPYAKLSDVPPGEYSVQAVLNVYETFHRADGTTVKLAPGLAARASTGIWHRAISTARRSS